MPTATDAFVSSLDGTRIYAQALGDPSKPPIVFIHGFSLSSLIFDPIFDDPKWSERLYLIRYDTRGHGQSDKPVDDEFWTSDRLAADFHAVIQRFNANRPYVAGWSLGATHLVDILAHHPSSYLRGLINVNGCPHTGLPRPVTSAAASVISRLLLPTDADDFQSSTLAFVDMLCTPAHLLPLNLRRSCLADIMLQPRVIARHLVMRKQDECGLMGTRSETKEGKSEDGDDLAMLVLLGENDPITNREGITQYMRARRNCKIVLLPEVDHTPWIGHPDLFRETALGWMDEH